MGFKNADWVLLKYTKIDRDGPLKTENACIHKVEWVTKQSSTADPKSWKSFSVPLLPLMLTNTYTVVLMQWSVSTAALPTRLRADARSALLGRASWLSGLFSEIGDNNEMQRNGVEMVAWKGRSSTSLYSSRRKLRAEPRREPSKSDRPPNGCILLRVTWVPV